jgi:hypothetical protein
MATEEEAAMIIQLGLMALLGASAPSAHNPPPCSDVFPVPASDTSYAVIENDKVYLDGNPDVRVARIDYETLRLFSADPDTNQSVRVSEFRLDRFDSGDLDIVAHFVYLADELRVYWRESYANRSYRFGIVDISGNGIAPRCEGSGGSEVTH